MKSKDMVNHPPHYNNHESGIECNEIREHIMNANLSAAFKYCWRQGLKDEGTQELKKAIWYLKSEINRINKYETEDSETKYLSPAIFQKCADVISYEKDDCLLRIIVAYMETSTIACEKAISTITKRLNDLNE